MKRYQYAWIWALIGLVYLCHLPIDVMEIDAAQYASIAREMHESGAYLQVYHRGNDYLDKPPLLFWLAALSFELFGVSNIAYKLPSVLVLILGLVSTYRLARLWYEKNTASLAALILGTTQAYMLMSNDVRTDGLLTGWVVFSLWQLSAYLQTRKWQALLLSGMGMGLAMMSKGPIGLVLPGLAVGAHLLISRQWQRIFDPRWLLCLGVVFISLVPMMIGLYQQFDLHPEKTVYGLEGPSGLEFFFWTQSFGRITGDIHWDNGAPPLFFVQTMLWDFQPWILLFLPAWGWAVWKLIRQRFKATEGAEYLSLGGFTLGFVMLSLSGYKLPHYVFPLFPLAAIMTAVFLRSLTEKALRIATGVQWGLMQLFTLAILVYWSWPFPPQGFWLPLVALGLYAFAWWLWLRSKGLDRLILPAVVIGCLFNLVAALDFYPRLLSYQATNLVGRKIEAERGPQDQTYYYRYLGHGMDFYAQQIVPYTLLGKVDQHPPGTWIFTDAQGWEEIQARSDDYRPIEIYDSYPVSRLSLPFIRPDTRQSKLRKLYLLEKQGLASGDKTRRGLTGN